jgi:hypothetical protein
MVSGQMDFFGLLQDNGFGYLFWVGKALVLLVGYWVWILDLKRIQKELEKKEVD